MRPVALPVLLALLVGYPRRGLKLVRHDRWLARCLQVLVNDSGSLLVGGLIVVVARPGEVTQILSHLGEAYAVVRCDSGRAGIDRDLVRGRRAGDVPHERSGLLARVQP